MPARTRWWLRRWIPTRPSKPPGSARGMPRLTVRSNSAGGTSPPPIWCSRWNAPTEAKSSDWHRAMLSGCSNSASSAPSSTDSRATRRCTRSRHSVLTASQRSCAGLSMLQTTGATWHGSAGRSTLRIRIGGLQMSIADRLTRSTGMSRESRQASSLWPGHVLPDPGHNPLDKPCSRAEPPQPCCGRTVSTRRTKSSKVCM